MLIRLLGQTSGVQMQILVMLFKPIKVCVRVIYIASHIDLGKVLQMSMDRLLTYLSLTWWASYLLSQSKDEVGQPGSGDQLRTHLNRQSIGR